MAEIKLAPYKSNLLPTALRLVVGMLFLGLLFAAGLIIQTPLGTSIALSLRWLFSTDSVQTMWYITRAAGLTSYLLLWLSVAWGLAVSSKIFNNLLHGSFTYDFHEFLSLAALGFIALHMIVLAFDGYMPYSLPQLLVPFLSPYRPAWVGIGAIAMYLSVLVTVTFYLRNKIGMKAFRAIHVLSLAAYLGVTFHGLFSGTDSSLTAVLGMYAGTFLVVVFLMTYWLFLLAQKKNQKKPAAGVQPGRQVATRF